MEILCTKDYSLFKQFNEQRELTPLTMAKLTRSMKKHGFKQSKPITVNSNMEVVDGQHRLQVARNLGLCVYYVIDDTIDIETVRDMAHATSPWSLGDYITSQIRQGNEDYKKLLALKDLSRLSWNAFLLSNFTSTRDVKMQIREGKLDITETKEEMILEFISKFSIFQDDNLGCKHWEHRAFAIAASQMFAHPDYDHEQFKKRLEYQSTRLVRCALVADYLQVFQIIYNYRSREQNIVDFTKRPR